MIKIAGRLLIFAGLALSSVAARADDATYPPGTECANQPTIAGRLLCGRQELRQNPNAAQQGQNVPAAPYDGYTPDEEASPRPATPAPIPVPGATPVPTAPGAPGSDVVHPE